MAVNSQKGLRFIIQAVTEQAVELDLPGREWKRQPVAGYFVLSSQKFLGQCLRREYEI